MERLESLVESELRYRPGEYRVEISADAAKEDIERNFPDFAVEEIEYLSEGMANIVFLVNGDFIFRFAKSEKANALCEKEIKALAKIKEQVDFFFREQMAHRTVRAIMLGDQKRTARHLERLRKQALGIGYWYNELREP